MCVVAVPAFSEELINAKAHNIAPQAGGELSLYSLLVDPGNLQSHRPPDWTGCLEFADVDLHMAALTELGARAGTEYFVSLTVDEGHARMRELSSRMAGLAAAQLVDGGSRPR